MKLIWRRSVDGARVHDFRQRHPEFAVCDDQFAAGHQAAGFIADRRGETLALPYVRVNDLATGLTNDDLKAVVASRPLMPGILRSASKTSKSFRLTCSSASGPLCALATSKPAFVKTLS